MPAVAQLEEWGTRAELQPRSLLLGASPSICSEKQPKKMRSPVRTPPGGGNKVQVFSRAAGCYSPIQAKSRSDSGDGGDACQKEIGQKMDGGWAGIARRRATRNTSALSGRAKLV